MLPLYDLMVVGWSRWRCSSSQSRRYAPTVIGSSGAAGRYMPASFAGPGGRRGFRGRQPVDSRHPTAVPAAALDSGDLSVPGLSSRGSGGSGCHGSWSGSRYRELRCCPAMRLRHRSGSCLVYRTFRVRRNPRQRGWTSAVEVVVHPTALDGSLGICWSVRGPTQVGTGACPSCGGDEQHCGEGRDESRPRRRSTPTDPEPGVDTGSVTGVVHTVRGLWKACHLVGGGMSTLDDEGRRSAR